MIRHASKTLRKEEDEELTLRSTGIKLKESANVLFAFNQNQPRESFMKRIFSYLIALAALLGGSILNAGTGPLFRISDSGNVGTTVPVAVCLNGKGPLSCQKHNAQALTLSITPVIADHNYPNAGIKVPAGYTLTGCTPYKNGYCLFSVSDGTPKTISMHQNNYYTLGGTISGLIGSVTLLNKENSTLLSQSSDGSFTFPNILANGSAYEVVVQTQPASSYHCTVTNGKGVINGSNVTSIKVTCSELVGAVSGTVTGLTSGQTVILQNNDENPQTVTNPVTSFTFPDQAVGSEYVVRVQTQPTLQHCTVSHGAGIMANGGVSNVAVTCATLTYPVGGTVSGLDAGKTVVLQLNGDETISKNSNSAFSFPTVADGTAYAVTVKTQPSNQHCVVAGGGNSDGTGTVSGAAVTNITVTCSNNITTLSVTPTSSSIEANPSNPPTILTVTNTGAYDATNVTIQLPAGWTHVTATPNGGCTSLAPSSNSCQITLTSSKPYTGKGGIIVSGDNTPTPPTVALAFSINSYLVFSVDSPSSATVVYPSNQGTSYDPPGWDVSNSCQYGTCVQTNATSQIDGSYLDSLGNTYKIISILGTQSSIDINAAGLCYNLASDNTGSVSNGTWYLPTICQLGAAGQGEGCPPGIANIDTNLYQLGIGNFATSGSVTGYWSSNENSANINKAWVEYFGANNSSYQGTLYNVSSIFNFYITS